MLLVNKLKAGPFSMPFKKKFEIGDRITSLPQRINTKANFYLFVIQIPGNGQLFRSWIEKLTFSLVFRPQLEY